jgi:hypothetical protein
LLSKFSVKLAVPLGRLAPSLEKVLSAPMVAYILCVCSGYENELFIYCRCLTYVDESSISRRWRRTVMKEQI